MSGTISEDYFSRAFTLGPTAGRELIYNIIGTDDETEAQGLLAGEAPAFYQGLELESVDVEYVGGGAWKAHAKYVRIENNNEYTFETSGGTQKITQSLGTTIYDFAGEDAYGDEVGTGPNFGGAIGVNGDTVEGVDITVPQYDFTETHYLADAVVTDAYKATLCELTSQICNAPFKGFDTGEVLFQGASGSKRGTDQWAITFRFSASRNKTGLTIGGITDIDKGGWDYLWVRYDDFEDDSAFALVKRPVAVYVEKVYYDGDFSLMSIGT